MGRHRSDPRGLARILIAAIAVALALALLVVGAIALVNALTSESPGPGAVSPSPTSAADGTKKTKPPPNTSAPPLQITVTGKPTDVFVKIAKLNGTVLQRGVLNTGETRRYEQAPLDVVVADPGAVEVRIYGQVTKAQIDDGRGTWSIPAR